MSGYVSSSSGERETRVTSDEAQGTLGRRKMWRRLGTRQMPERCFKKVYLLLWLLFFQESDVVYVPCSGLTGENLTKCCNEPLLRKWYNGPTLLDRIGKK